MAVQKAVTNGKSQAQEDVAAAVTQAIVITMLAVTDLKLNRLNPNVMTAEQYAAFAKEVKAQKRIPKPIVVVKAKVGFEVVDGGHALRAAIEAEMTHVPCEVRELDKFEAMREMLLRNRHGENNPVLLGQLYSKMLKVGKLSNYELAEKLDTTEGTIRNYLNYDEAFKLRNGYAPKGAFELISGLTIKKAAAYVELPPGKGNEWLDSGASLEEAAKLIPAKPKAERAVESSNAAKAESPVSDEDENDTDDDNATPEDDSDAESSPDEDAEAGGDDGDANEKGGADDDQDDSVAEDDDATTEPVTPAFDKKVLKELEDAWRRANEVTRQKFVGAILADAGMLKFVRRLFREGA